MARAKEFDTDQAIDKALEVFWQNGFNKASLTMLTQATGLHKGSLYGTFKSKEHLFQLCLDRYMGNSRRRFYNSQQSPAQYLSDFFKTKLNCNKTRRAKGCLLMNSSIEFSNDPKEKKKLNELLKGIENNLKTVVKAGIDSGEFPKITNASQMAERLLALAFTIEEMGKLGKDKKFLANVANGVLKDLDIQV